VLPRWEQEYSAKSDELVRLGWDNSHLRPGQWDRARSKLQDEADWIANIPINSLRPIARYMALKNIVQMVWPRSSTSTDRGIELERDWAALRIPFTCFREAERAGLIPSLVFSPMTVDDGRRLLITNLDMRFPPHPGPLVRLLPLSRGSSLLDRNDGSRLSNHSLSGLEFFKAFPDHDGQNDILLSTAARMSASFPFVSPAVNLPSYPPLRVVDAGYFDDYGVDVATAWLFRNRPWLKKNTSGVLMIQVRDALSSNDRFGVPQSPGLRARLLQGLQFFFSPLDGVMQARYTSSSFRNDEQVAALSDLFWEETGRRDFFTTAVFELSANLTLTAEPGSAQQWPGDDLSRQVDLADASSLDDVAMTWYLTMVERQAIIQAIPDRSHLAGTAGKGGIVPTDEREKFLVRRIENKNLENPCCRLERIEDLTKLLDKPLEPMQTAVVLKELARARNYEVVEAIKKWWTVDHLQGKPPNPEAEDCTHMHSTIPKAGP